MKRVVLVSSAILLGACGALFNSGPANVALSTNPPGAEVLVNGTSRGISPLTLSLAKNQNYTVTFRRAGYQDTSVEIRRKVSGGYVILDILGGVLPVIVDAATGSWYVLDTNNVNVNLLPNTARSGQLDPQQLAAVRLGTPIAAFVDM